MLGKLYTFVAENGFNLEKPLVDVIIPAFNEEKSIHLVLAALPKQWIREAIVCNNGSTDQTANVARQAGATVVDQPLKGYGNACLAGIDYLQRKHQKPDIVVFLDGDYSDYPEETPDLLRPIWEGGCDMVIGSRALGVRQRGAMTPQQVFGNWLATTLMRWLYQYHFTDLGPFRAIKYDKLLELQMDDKNYGWTVEMQVKAAMLGLKCQEIPVKYRRRVGVSKVSGTVKGTIMAGYKILWTIFKLATKGVKTEEKFVAQ
ncbi:MAG TPA: glycosyltransferase family 2 protein [Saprospiraceae bacterium]|nr:glycosyltransferase family 2 protein [Saprospiraceae bacterium]HMQ82428.1 glycosyltransferase family 2 protein [Saprospiraceae bacterium]